MCVIDIYTVCVASYMVNSNSSVILCVIHSGFVCYRYVCVCCVGRTTFATSTLHAFISIGLINKIIKWREKTANVFYEAHVSHPALIILSLSNENEKKTQICFFAVLLSSVVVLYYWLIKSCSMSNWRSKFWRHSSQSEKHFWGIAICVPFRLCVSIQLSSLSLHMRCVEIIAAAKFSTVHPKCTINEWVY